MSSSSSSSSLKPRSMLKEFRSCLEKEGLSPSMIGDCSLQKGTLFLTGRVTRDDGSLFNLCVADFAKQNAEIKQVSRQGVKFVKPALKDKKHYELSVADDELKEYFDSPALLQRKITYLTGLIRQSRHFVVYTGAGVSTSAKIPDFRGPNGVWTNRDRNLPAPDCIEMEQALPTYAHNCLVKWQDDRLMKYLVSQNVDGLHRRSGIRADMISELHGNCYIEICASCQAEYLRTYDVCNHAGPHFKGVKDKLSKSGISHITGRKCDKCSSGMLRDSIIHFSESLPEQALERGIENSKNADVGLVLGSSLRVTPACDLPLMIQGPLCIVNLQSTGKDLGALETGGILIHAKIDYMMSLLMKELGYQFPYKGEDEKDQQAEENENDEQNQKEETDKKQEVKQSTNTTSSSSSSSSSSSLPDHFYVGNLHKLQRSDDNDDNTHLWTMMLSRSADGSQSSAQDLQFISSVEYQLHSTFSPNKITISEPPFQLSRLGWGTFTVKCTINFQQQLQLPPLVVSHKLSFEKDVSMQKWILARPCNSSV